MWLFFKYIIQSFIERTIFYREVSYSKKVSSFLENPMPITDLADFVNTSKQVLLKDAQANSFFYQKQSVDKYSFDKLPITTKEVIKNNFGAFVNNRFLSLKKFRFRTGGSTGEPFEFEIARWCGFIDRYHFLYFFKKIGYKKGDKIISFDGLIVPSKLQNRNIYWKRTKYKDIPYGSLHFSTLNLNSKTYIYYYNKIEKEKPAFIRAYPSVLIEFANYLTANNLQFSFYLKGIILSSENIYKWQIDILSNVFKTPVYGQYGHSEMCLFAFTKANSLEYVCSPYYGFVEILNDNNKPVEVGEIGRVVATSYYNKAMFFIRYETGDIAQFGGYNADGFPILTQIIGRDYEYIYDTKGSKVNITALIFGAHYMAFSNIVKWQIIQKIKGEIILLIVKGKGYTEKDENEIIDNFQKNNINITFSYVDHISLTKRGKHKLIVNEVREDQ